MNFKNFRQFRNQASSNYTRPSPQKSQTLKKYVMSVIHRLPAQILPNTSISSNPEARPPILPKSEMQDLLADFSTKKQSFLPTHNSVPASAHNSKIEDIEEKADKLPMLARVERESSQLVYVVKGRTYHVYEGDTANSVRYRYVKCTLMP